MSLLFIALSFPIMCTIAIIIKMSDRGPFLYKGIRLGIGKCPFYMYKFRTLPISSQKELGAELYTSQKIKISPFLRLMRDSRLDELPQLFNVLKGEMDFIGPRPVRPEVYESIKGKIPNYDLRFRVRPGLIGFSQLFTPHSTPKRIRSLIDNKYITIKRDLFWDTVNTFYTGLKLTKNFIFKFSRLFYNHIIKRNILKLYSEKRELERILHKNSFVFFYEDDTQKEYTHKYKLHDLNELYFSIKSQEDADTVSSIAKFCKIFKIRSRRKTKFAKVNISYFKSYKIHEENIFIHIFKYEPISQFNYYIVEKYFLEKSIF